MIKVSVTDDHIVVIDGLKNALSAYSDILITGAYSNATELLAGLKNEQPDVLLLDLQLPGKSGKEIVPHLLMQYPDLKILVLSGLEECSYITEMMHKGCKGYLFKSTADQDTLLQAIRSVHAGQLFLNPAIKEQLLQEMLSAKQKASGLRPTLTRREKEILRLIAAGYHSQQIADMFFISLRTVETHRYNLMQKLNVKNTAGLIIEALHYKY